MADRLTQLQDSVTQQSEHFYNSIGILQQLAPSSPFPGFEKPGGKAPSPPPPQEDHAALFAKLITRTAKDIDVLIDALPSEDSSSELQNASLQRLEVENQEEAERLEEIVTKGENLLEMIQKALADIASSQLSCQALESSLSGGK